MLEPGEGRFPSSSEGWQRRLIATIATLLLLTGALVAGPVVGELSRPPRLVYPPGAEPSIDVLRQTGARKPISEELLAELLAKYELEPCVVGRRYGALCDDGEVIYGGADDICENHGGVKGWIGCR